MFGKFTSTAKSSINPLRLLNPPPVLKSPKKRNQCFDELPTFSKSANTCVGQMFGNDRVNNVLPSRPCCSVVRSGRLFPAHVPPLGSNLNASGFLACNPSSHFPLPTSHVSNPSSQFPVPTSHVIHRPTSLFPLSHVILLPCSLFPLFPCNPSSHFPATSHAILLPTSLLPLSHVILFPTSLFHMFADSVVDSADSDIDSADSDADSVV